MQKSSLLTLIELAQNDVDVAAKQLGFCIKLSNEAHQQLTLLTQYRSDYELRLQSNAQQGLNVIQYANFQSFIIKLDQAIEGQKKIISDAEYKVETAKRHWQEQEKKRLSYETIVKRQQQLAIKKEAKQDQKQTDERATHALFYKNLKD
ncbi:MAG: flagellar export protein FliJ [Burkholderiales bacterium]|nr:flagellar export protein FliJ [Burkholderiales bacterium]